MNNESIKIFSVFHKPFHKPTCNNVVAIQAGKSLSNIDLNIETDNDNNNISLKNKTFCELTVLYNIWKNQKYKPATYWGLCHYRRYFCLDMHWTKIKTKDTYFFKEDKVDFNKILSAKFFTFLQKNIGSNTVITARPFYIVNSQNKSITVEQHYKTDHDEVGWNILYQVVKDLYPNYVQSFTTVANRYYLYCYNMMIAHHETWDNYLTWLFNILFEVEKKYEIPTDAYQSRAIGFMAERLMNVYLQHHNYKIIALPIAAIM